MSDAPSLSATIISTLCNESPLHAWTKHPKLNPDYQPEDAEHFDIGKAAHSILLEGTSQPMPMVVPLGYPDWRTKEARGFRDRLRAEGRIPILMKHFTEVEAMVVAARGQLAAHRDAKDMFTTGKPEVVVRWEEDGIACSARLDWLHDSHLKIDEYKTVGGSANPEAWTRGALFQQGGDVQASWYLRAVRTIYGKDAQFRFAVQETFPPYALSVIAPGPDVLMLADKKCAWAKEQWKRCLETGEWPGYPDRICYATLPAWAESQWLEKELR